MANDSTENQRRETYDNWRSRAPAWDQWADHLEKLAKGLNEPLVAAAGIAAGHRVLDLASGAGEPSLMIARAVGPQGQVTATDLVPDMLDVARRRAAAAGLDNVRFETADMQALPFADASFDAVTCRLGLMYTPEPERAVAEARRVLQTGGRAAFMVWGPQADNTQFVVLEKVLDEEVGIDAHEGAFTPTRLGEPGQLTEIFTAAGFAEVDEQEHRFHPRIDPASRFWRPQVALRAGDKLDQLSEAARTRLDEAMAAAFEAYRDGDRVALEVHARIGIGYA